MRTITFYTNRKYYDKSLRGHVTLLDIIQAVKDGDEFKVVTTGGVDITTETINAAIYKHLTIPVGVAKELVQQFYEVEEKAPGFLPRENTFERF